MLLRIFVLYQDFVCHFKSKALLNGEILNVMIKDLIEIIPKIIPY